MLQVKINVFAFYLRVHSLLSFQKNQYLTHSNILLFLTNAQINTLPNQKTTNKEVIHASCRL